MSGGAVTKDGLQGARRPRDAVTGGKRLRTSQRRGRRGEQPVVPRAEFSSYYGQPVLNPPVWKSTDIAGYLFLGGLAGASSVLAAGADLSGRPELATRAKVVSTAAIGLSAAALVHDLGRPDRFYNMLRVLKPTSPMSVGSWLLSLYGPASGVASLTQVSGRLPRLGRLATLSAAALGPAVATYTAALIGDTAVPAWHDGWREMPFVFAGSSATAAGGMGLALAPLGQAGPARRMAALGATAEFLSAKRLERHLGDGATPYKSGKGGAYMRTGEALTAAGLGLAVVGRRNRLLTGAAGALLVCASAATRFGIFHAGMSSADDPRYTVEPQRAERNDQERGRLIDGQLDEQRG